MTRTLAAALSLVIPSRSAAALPREKGGAEAKEKATAAVEKLELEMT